MDAQVHAALALITKKHQRTGIVDTFCFLGSPVACFLVDLACSMSRHLSLMRLNAPSFNTESFTHSACVQEHQH